MMLHKPGDRVVLMGSAEPMFGTVIKICKSGLITVQWDKYGLNDMQPNDLYSLEDLEQYTKDIEL